MARTSSRGQGPRPTHRRLQSISKANFVTGSGWDPERGCCPERNEFRSGICRAGRFLLVAAPCRACPGDSDCDARKCAIQSWNLNNGNKNYEHEYFNVLAICIRKPLRGPTPALNVGHKMKSAAKQPNSVWTLPAAAAAPPPSVPAQPPTGPVLSVVFEQFIVVWRCNW